jgi:hypothetical protein
MTRASADDSLLLIGNAIAEKAPWFFAANAMLHRRRHPGKNVIIKSLPQAGIFYYNPTWTNQNQKEKIWYIRQLADEGTELKFLLLFSVYFISVSLKVFALWARTELFRY